MGGVYASGRGPAQAGSDQARGAGRSLERARILRWTEVGGEGEHRETVQERLDRQQAEIATQAVGEGAQHRQRTDAGDKAGQHQALHEAGLPTDPPLDGLAEPLQASLQLGRLAGQPPRQQGAEHQHGLTPAQIADALATLARRTLAG
jgi:hypothetical protein